MRIMAKMDQGSELPWREKFMVEVSGDELLRIIGEEYFRRDGDPSDTRPSHFKIGDEIPVSAIFNQMMRIREAAGDLENVAAKLEELANMARDTRQEAAVHPTCRRQTDGLRAIICAARALRGP